MRKGQAARRSRSRCAPPRRPARTTCATSSGAHPFDGARVANILPGVADELGLDERGGRRHPVRASDSRAARIGFQPGDIIQQVGRDKVETVSALEELVKERQRVWLVMVKRGNQTMRLQLAG